MKWRRRVYFILWIASLVGISYYGGAISYGLFWGMTLIMVVAFVYLIMVYFQFKIYQRIDTKTIVCKEPIPYFFVLSNETFFAFVSVSVKLYSKLSSVNDMVDGREYQLLPGDEYEYHTSLVCKYRGEYEVGVKEITVTDIFGLFRLRYKIPSTIRAVVLPRILHLDEIESLKEVVNISYMETSINPVEPDVVTRDYVTGDAMKWIHWKSSAKAQKLKTRKLLGERRNQVAIVYDTKRYSKDQYTYLPLENQILEAVIAIGSFLVSKNIGFVSYSSQRGIRKNTVEGIHQFQSFYNDVSGTSFYENEDFRESLNQLSNSSLLSDVQTLVLVAHEISVDDVGMLHNIAGKGVNIVLYLITDDSVEEIQRLANQRVKVYPLPTEGDLEEIL